METQQLGGYSPSKQRPAGKNCNCCTSYVKSQVFCCTHAKDSDSISELVVLYRKLFVFSRLTFYIFIIKPTIRLQFYIVAIHRDEV